MHSLEYRAAFAPGELAWLGAVWPPALLSPAVIRAAAGAPVCGDIRAIGGPPAVGDKLGAVRFEFSHSYHHLWRRIRPLFS